jgi:hypothetical protein
VSTPQRAALEARFHLANGERREGTTWSYQLTDPSFLNIHALVRDPAVDDTANINRRLFRPALADDRVARIVLGALVVGAVAALVPFIRSRGRIVSRTIVVDERTIVRVAGAAPAALVAGAVMLLLLALVRYQPLWASKDVPLTEAARHGDIAEVFRLVNAGADPNPALEAGVESRQVEVLQVLVNAGATADESRRQRLACLAVAVTAPEVSDYLRSTLPSATQPDCPKR